MLHSTCSLAIYVASKINHIRHLIKIQFVNKRIEFINLPSIFKDKSVISSIPTYFENKESPIICYKFNKGAQWLSGRVLDSRPRGHGFEPHRRHSVVVLEQDTFILA